MRMTWKFKEIQRKKERMNDNNFMIIVIEETYDYYSITE